MLVSKVHFKSLTGCNTTMLPKKEEGVSGALFGVKFKATR